MGEIVFTPAAILELLNQIDELSEYDLSITETIDGKLQLQIGTSVYDIDTQDIEEVPVAEEVLDAVENINEDAYETLVQDEGFNQDDQEPVEGGLIKEAIKSLLLGGAVKLIKKLI